jgi:hypothetical protein
MRLGSSPVSECASPLALLVRLTTGLENTRHFTAPEFFLQLTYHHGDNQALERFTLVGRFSH